MKKVSFYTLGCKVNQYETEAMAELFENAGYEISDFSEFCDVYVINTCTVTNMSDRKSRQIIRRAKKINPNSIVVVTGCYAQTASADLLKISDVNVIIGTKDRREIVKIVEKARQDEVVNYVTDIMKTHNFEDLHVNTYKDRTRAYIKIQEGCNQFCSYCIIPYARGPIRSRKKEEVILEAKRLADEGFSEIVLTGIHVASYGLDLKTTDLADIILELEKVDGIKRIRLSSIEPMALDENFVKKISKSTKLCHHFHISLQSGCDETLKRMNRKYTSFQYKSIVDGLKKAFPDVAITTDIMVGFPGEDNEEFSKSLAFFKEIGFADAHVFQYSRRKGTPADKAKNQVADDVKEARSKECIKAGEESKAEFLKNSLGKTVEVLFEQPCHKNPDYFEGKTDNYITVLVKTDQNLSGKILSVKLEKITQNGIEGELV